jgi:TnpA family transposase
VSISDKNQDPEVQLVPMREFSARRGWMVVDEYVDYARAADLMRTVISIREGRVSSVVLPRRLSNDSKKNRLYRAFRELGRVVRTIVLLRYLSEP